MTLCILHLGSEKTGTSSVQKYFGARRAELLEKGFWYPRAFCNPDAHVHLRLSDAAIDGNLTQDAIEVGLFERELGVAQKANFKAAIFSSEFFHSEMRDNRSVSYLKEFLSQYFGEFQLHYYARRQDQMLASMHSTAVKGGWTTSHDAMSVYESKGHHYFDHSAVCNLWAGEFGAENMRCRVYERDKLVNGDIVEDLTAAIGIKLTGDTPLQQANESLSLETLCALLLLNGSKHKDNKEFRRRLIAMGKKRNGKRTPMLKRSDALAFHDRFRDTNREFFARYVESTLATEFSADFSGFPDTLPHISAEEIQSFIFG